MDRFFDSYVDERGGKFISYRMGENVYEEAFADGIYYAAGWLGSGYTPQQIIYGSVPRMNFRAFVEGSAFRLNVDGVLLYSFWDFVSWEKENVGKGLLVTVKLHHQTEGIDVAVRTLLDGSACMTRWLEITNTRDTTRRVAEMSILSGGLSIEERPDLKLRPGETVWKIGYMQEANWGEEGAFGWHDISEGYSVSGRFARERMRHPMFVLANRASGQHFICQIGYSGGWKCEFDYNHDVQPGGGSCGLLSMRVGLDGYAPLAVIGPGETIKTPEIHFGMTCGDLDTALNAMHDHVRLSVVSHVTEWDAPLEVGLGPEMDMDIGGVMNSIDYAVEYGSEYFVLDCCWNAQGGGDTTPYTWIPHTERYEMGIKGVRDYCHEKGLKFGLWMEPERIFSADCPFMKDNPTACANDYAQPLTAPNAKDGPLALDRPEVADAVFEMIDELITHYDLEMFRLDHNGYKRSYRLVDGSPVYSDFDYFRRWYDIFDRLRAKHPKCMFENCASGGGRTDLGMMAHMDHTWVTDWQRAPRSFVITNGMTMALPPELVDRIIGAQNGHIDGSFRFQSYQLLFGRPTLNASTVNGYRENPQQAKILSPVLKLYKEVIQPHFGDTLIFHHTPEFDAVEPKGTGILERAGRNGEFSVLGIFNLADSGVFDGTVRFRGADVSAEYELTFLSTGKTAKVSGYTLACEGVRVRVAGALNAEVLSAVKIG